MQSECMGGAIYIAITAASVNLGLFLTVYELMLIDLGFVYA